jgi:hypothetical protein
VWVKAHTEHGRAHVTHRPRTRHYSLATYVLLRGLTLLVRCGNKAAAAAQPSCASGCAASSAMSGMGTTCSAGTVATGRGGTGRDGTGRGDAACGGPVTQVTVRGSTEGRQRHGGSMPDGSGNSPLPVKERSMSAQGGAAGSGSSSSWQLRLLSALLSPTRLAHGDTLLMCASSAQIIYSFIMAPSTLPAVRPLQCGVRLRARRLGLEG